MNASNLYIFSTMGDVRIWVSEELISLLKSNRVDSKEMENITKEAIKESGWNIENPIYERLLSKGIQLLTDAQKNPDRQLPLYDNFKQGEKSVRIGIYPENPLDWLVDRFHKLSDSVAEIDDKRKLDSSTLGSYILKHSKFLEKWATKTIADHLGEYSCIIQTSYKPKWSSGDIDGIVSGKYNGKDIIVFIEVKENLDSGADRRKAIEQMERTLNLWEDLRNLPSDEIGNQEDEFKADYKNLQVEKHQDCKVCCAFAAYKFSDQSMKDKMFKKIDRPKFFIRKIKDEQMEILETNSSEEPH